MWIANREGSLECRGYGAMLATHGERLAVRITTPASQASRRTVAIAGRDLQR